MTGAPSPRGFGTTVAGAVGAYVLLTSFAVSFPIIGPDEFGYLSDARALAGRGRVLVAPGIGSYPWGYPLLLAPLVLVTDGPLALYRLTLVLNAALLAGLVPCVVAILRRLGFPPAAALAAAAALALHPSLFTFAHLALSENLFVPVQALAVLALLALVDRGSPWAAAGFGVALAVSPFVRSIGVATTAAGLLVLAGLARRVEARRPAAVACVALVVTGIALAGIDRLLPGFQAYGELSASSRLGGALADPVSLARTLAGQFVSISLSAWLLFPVVLVGAARLLPRALRTPKPEPADWMVLFVAAAALGTLAISAVFLRDGPRADHGIYARYGEGLLPAMACAGLHLLRTGAVPRWMVGLPAVAGLVLVSSGAPGLVRGEFEVVPVSALFVPLQVWALRSLPLVTAILGIGMAILWKWLLRGSRVAVAAVLLLHVAAGLEILFRYHAPGSRSRATQAAFGLDLAGHRPAVAQIGVLGPDRDGWAHGLLAFAFPRAALVDREDARSDLVVAPKALLPEARPGYRLVSLQQHGPFAAWLREGVGDPGLPPVWLPASEVSDYRASLEILERPHVRWRRLAVLARVANLGTGTFPDVGILAEGPWAQTPVRLGVRFEDGEGRTLAEERIELPRPLPPAAWCEVRGSVRLPAAAAWTTVDLVHEGRRWFGLGRRYRIAEP